MPHLSSLCLYNVDDCLCWIYRLRTSYTIYTKGVFGCLINGKRQGKDKLKTKKRRVGKWERILTKARPKKTMCACKAHSTCASTCAWVAASLPLATTTYTKTPGTALMRRRGATIVPSLSCPLYSCPLLSTTERSNLVGRGASSSPPAALLGEQTWGGGWGR